MRSGAECGCRTETHLHDFFLAVVGRAAVLPALARYVKRD